MPFEVFKRQRVRPGQGPSVTIQRKGVLSLNRATYEALGAPKAVELLWDDDERRMGIRKVDPRVGHAYPVRPLGRGATWLVSGTAFTQYYGIKTPMARRWDAVVEDGLVVIDLKQPGTEVQANRAARVAAET